MNTAVINVQLDPVDAVLEVGLKDLWFPVCPSSFVKDSPVSLRRLGYKIALWRDQAGKVHALEDHCPHRGAPLSLGVILGDRMACPYHGVEVRCDGTVTRVPGSPGCKLEGSRPTRTFHTAESNGAIFLYNASNPALDEAPPLRLPEQLTSPEWSFLPLLHRMGRRLPLCGRQRDGPDARRVPAQAVAHHERRRHDRPSSRSANSRTVSSSRRRASAA